MKGIILELFRVAFTAPGRAVMMSSVVKVNP